jgi:hypothetical protein
MDDFNAKVVEFQESDSTSSPIWIWFERNQDNVIQSKCLLCKVLVSRKDGNTSGMTNHLKRSHGFFSRYDAWKIYEELSELKEKRMKNMKRKHSLVSDESSQPKQKQQKISDCVNSQYGTQDSRQKNRNNAVASMICTDAAPVHIVERPEFIQMMKTVDPRYKLPCQSTFSRLIIPKLNNSVQSHQMKMMKVISMIRRTLNE